MRTGAKMESMGTLGQKPKANSVSSNEEDMETQTYVPEPEHEIRHGARPPAKLRSLEDIEDVAKNRYEAVLIASARARQLNAKKVALEERGMEEALVLKRIKMTIHALDELLDGKLKVDRPEDMD
jgi:DNA-directed RNA polymerase subunit K/omega